MAHAAAEYEAELYSTENFFNRPVWFYCLLE